MKSYFVYVLTNWDGSVMYIGVTNNLERCIFEHKNKLVVGFTSKYNVDKLVYFEGTTDMQQIFGCPFLFPAYKYLYKL